MTHFSLYSIPAVLALLTKAAIFYFSQRATSQPIQGRIFRIALGLSILLNVAEIVVLQKISPQIDYWGGVFYYAISTLLLPLLVHLAISLSFDNWDTRRFIPTYVLLYGVAIAICITFVFFTPLLMTGARDLGGYTATAIQGPFYWVYRTFLMSSLISLVLIPAIGLRGNRPESKRSQCKLWILAVSPLVLLIGVITYLLHLGIHRFNATVTTPLLIALFLGTLGYIVHNARVIELNFYIPWSSARRSKEGLYKKLNELSGELPHFECLQELLNRIANILGCPIALVLSDNSVFAATNLGKTSSLPSTEQLRQFTRLTVIYETNDISPSSHEIMLRHNIEAVIPFFPYSNTGACWMICGPPFSQHIHSALDFRVLQRLFEKLSGLLIDQVLALSRETHIEPAELNKDSPSGTAMNYVYRPPKPLEECIAEFEASCISAALQRTNGNRAEAARLLGLKPNTLHYKLRRHGFK